MQKLYRNVLFDKATRSINKFHLKLRIYDRRIGVIDKKRIFSIFIFRLRNSQVIRSEK